MSKLKKKKPAGRKPWFDRLRRTIFDKSLRRGLWNLDRWDIYEERRNDLRDRPRRPKRMALRLTWTAERDAEVRRQQRNAELYPARRARMIALNARRREERAQRRH